MDYIQGTLSMFNQDNLEQFIQSNDLIRKNIANLETELELQALEAIVKYLKQRVIEDAEDEKSEKYCEL